MKKNISFIILVILIIGVISFWQRSVWLAKDKAIEVVNQESTPENKVILPVQEEQIQAQTKVYITFTFSDADRQTISYPILEDNTKSLFAISQEIAKEKNWDWQYQSYAELGTLVTKINNTKNGQDNKYWQYYSEGKQPQISADKYTPQADEKIEWRFAESKF